MNFKSKNAKLEWHLANLFRARFSLIYIPTWEENRVLELLAQIADNEELIKTKRMLYIWSQTQGFYENGTGKAMAESKAPMKALELIEKSKEAGIFVLKDFHVFLGAGNKQADYGLIRKLRDLANRLKQEEKPKSIVILSPVMILPEDLQKDVTILDFDLPRVDEIWNMLDEMIEVNQRGGKMETTMTDREKNQMSKAALGLTLQEAENAFARAMVERGKLTIDELDIIMDEKCQVIKKTGILEFIKSDLNIEDVGGLENLKRWLCKRNKSWLETAVKYNLPSPKGVLITGVPGCGKSLTAKAISAMWKLPLLRLDMGKIFSGLVGSSEENMRKAIKTAEAVSPSVLWIDEIEKGLGGSIGSNGDSGTSTRIFGTFLTWMQEKTLPVFVVATANNIRTLPPEMLRKGRFDEIFFVDLPTVRERSDIFKLHLKKRLIDPDISKNISLGDMEIITLLAESTEGFSGAEIEQIIIAALFEAFSEDRPLDVQDLYQVIRNMVPLSVTQSEQIIEIRNWANVRAVAATATEDRNEYFSEYRAPLNSERLKKVENEEEADIVRKNRGGRFVDF